MFTFINEINKSNSTNYKLEILKKYKNDKLLERLLSVTYDKVTYRFGIGKVVYTELFEKSGHEDTKQVYSISEVLQLVELFELFENDNKPFSKTELIEYFEMLPISTKHLFLKIVDRDLKINVGTKQIAKVFQNVIKKPPYMRCSILDQKAIDKKLKLPAEAQLKVDGTYREIIKSDENITARTREGNISELPVIFEEMKGFDDGVYFGELTYDGETDRAKGNGIINSDNPDHNRIRFTCWDYVTFEDYDLAIAKGKPKVKFKDRFIKLKEILGNIKTPHIDLIESKTIYTQQELSDFVTEQISKGLEGAVIKNFDMVFKNGTSGDMFKCKIKLQIDVRCIGFNNGKVGTKREGKVGSIIFSTDDNKLQGSCSGFTDEQLDEFTNNPDKYLMKVFEVECSGISLAKDSTIFALMHPRFIEFRDKEDTDTFERVHEMINAFKF